MSKALPLALESPTDKLGMLIEAMYHELMLLHHNHDHYQQQALEKQSVSRRDAMRAFAAYYEERIVEVRESLAYLSRF